MEDKHTNKEGICAKDDKDVRFEKETLYVSRAADDIDDLMGVEVQSEEEAYKLYKDYGIRKGFSVRKSRIRYRTGTREIRQKEYCCSKEGFMIDANPCETKYRNRFEIRSGCEAMVRFTVIDGIWKITKFVSNHNHELALLSEIHLLRTCRQLSTPKANVIDTMTNAGIRTRDAYAYMSGEVGGHEHVGFTKTDCYNFVNKQKLAMIEAGDSQSVINHFKQRAIEDGMFIYTVQVDEENRMSNFFWRDGRSRIDYDCFGDVVIFYTTYRTNRYNLICAPFVGINHHWQNIMFGCAFLSDEREASFIWLFKSFLESMGG